MYVVRLTFGRGDVRLTCLCGDMIAVPRFPRTLNAPGFFHPDGSLLWVSPVWLDPGNPRPYVCCWHRSVCDVCVRACVMGERCSWSDVLPFWVCLAGSRVITFSLTAPKTLFRVVLGPAPIDIDLHLGSNTTGTPPLPTPVPPSSRAPR